MSHGDNIVDRDPYFEIDINTRQIVNKSSTKTLITQNDHNSERFTFSLPRYVEGHDMLECDSVTVHYRNIGTSVKEIVSGIYDVVDLQEGENDTITGTWLLSQNVTSLVGKLEFSVHFHCYNDEGDITYAWHTSISKSISVQASLFNSETIYTEYADVLEQWHQEVLGITQNAADDVAEIRGTNNISGGKGFKIIEMGWVDEAEGTGYYVLQDLAGLEAGMVVSVCAGITVSGEQTITAIDTETNTITVSGYRENAIDTKADDIENCVVHNYITVVGRPDLGHIEIGFNALAIGQNTMAQDVNTFAGGRDTKAIGKYGVALNSNTKAGYACLATGNNNEVLGVWSFGAGRENKSYGEGCTILGEQGLISSDAWYSLIGNGQGNKVLAPFGAAFGQWNTVGSDNQVVIGTGNVVDEERKYVFIIGNGGSQNKSNAFTVDWQGNADMRGLKIKGSLIDFNSFATKSEIGDINTALDNIIAIQNELAGDSV